VPFRAGEKTRDFIQEKGYESEFRKLLCDHIFTSRETDKIIRQELDNLFVES
jgi:hypothetical protein